MGKLDHLSSNKNRRNAHKYLTRNHLNIELKISDQEGHVLSDMPHWSKTLPSMTGHRWLSRVISKFNKVNMILMHGKDTGISFDTQEKMAINKKE